MVLIRRSQRNGTETLGTESAALAIAGIVLGTGRLFACSGVRYVTVAAVVGGVDGMGITGLNRHSQGRQRGRPGQRRRQQHGYEARKYFLTSHAHTLPDITRGEKSA
jgi:hypothetical protein